MKRRLDFMRTSLLASVVIAMVTSHAWAQAPYNASPYQYPSTAPAYANQYAPRVAYRAQEPVAVPTPTVAPMNNGSSSYAQPQAAPMMHAPAPAAANRGWLFKLCDRKRCWLR